MGNELCGRRGVFNDPGTPQWQIGPEGHKMLRLEIRKDI